MKNHDCDPNKVLDEMLLSLWPEARDRTLGELLPRSLVDLADFYSTLRRFVGTSADGIHGSISTSAIVEGSVQYLGEGAEIEAGAVIHRSARLYLGRNSRIRAGAVIRDEVVVGDDCTIGVNCEVCRSLVVGPNANIAHLSFVADTILGAGVNLAGNTIVANTNAGSGRRVDLRTRGAKVDSQRSHLGLVAGDNVRLGASTTTCPGCIILPGLVLPPGVVLLGTIDEARRRELFDTFFSQWGDHPR